MSVCINNKSFKDPTKYKQMLEINNKLGIKTGSTNKIVFVYSEPKVGSTTIVSSLRIFAAEKITIIHVHDENMLKVLGNITNTTVNEIIQFNQYIGRDVFVIDVYRNPIERKISAFFEKVSSLHFNNVDEKVNNYNINLIIKRFNRIFPYIGTGDHFMDVYGITLPKEFDYIKKYMLVEENGIKYLKLRLKDVQLWDKILSDVLGHKICIVKDYETKNKLVGNLYQKFKKHYKIPINYLEDIKTDKYLNYYYSDIEMQTYISEWNKKVCAKIEAFTPSQYDVYDEITIDNSHLDYIQTQHYIDEGCVCKACNIKRIRVRNQILNGNPIAEKIYHNEAKYELFKMQLQTTKMKNNRRKDFTAEMKQIVTRKR